MAIIVRLPPFLNRSVALPVLAKLLVKGTTSLDGPQPHRQEFA